MALFNYNKPGPGISKNSGYQVNRFALYFQLLGRKFWNICVLNLILVLFSLPFGGAAVALFNILKNVHFFLYSDFRLILIVSGLPFMFYGPVLAAAFKVARDFAREEPAFVFLDFVNTIKKNVKKPIILSAMFYFLFAALTFAIPAYYTTPGIGIYVLFPLCLFATLVLIMIQFYVYTMSVCFDLTLKEVLKNGLILAMVSMGQNILILFVLLFLLLVCVSFFMVALSGTIIMFGFLIIMLACFLPTFFLFTCAFVTHPIMQRYIVEPYYEANPQKTSAVLQKSSDSGLFANNPIEEKEIPEYVYHNGRMVHRSVLESESLFDDERKIGPDRK